MAETISKSLIKPRLLHYLRLVDRHRRSYTITDRGRPVARLEPIRQRRRTTRSRLADSVVRYDDPLRPVDVDEWDVLA